MTFDGRFHCFSWSRFCSPTPCSARLPSLYSDFRHLKGTNPEGFVSNVQSWESGLRDAAREALIPESEDTLLISLGPTIDNALESHDFGRPMAIDAALVGVVLFHTRVGERS